MDPEQPRGRDESRDGEPPPWPDDAKLPSGEKPRVDTQRGLFSPPPERSLQPLRRLVSIQSCLTTGGGPTAINPYVTIRTQRPEISRAIQKEYNFQDSLVPTVLAARGYEPGADLDFRLNPSLSSLPDIREMKNGRKIVSHIVDCVLNKRPLAIFTDFDNDGIVSNMIATDLLKSVGFEALYSAIPIREESGYGFTEPFFRKHHQALEARFGEGPKSILTADFGTTNKREILLAQELGYWVGVLDHHHVGDVDCPAVLGNPGQTGCGFEDNVLAANGLMLLTMMAVHDELRSRGRSTGEVDLSSYLVPVAIATLADCVPLRGASWTMAFHGLRMFKDSPFPVFDEMLKRRGIFDQPSGSDLSLMLAPMINAPGRLGDANFMIDALATRDRKEARKSAELFFGINERRKDIEHSMLQEAIAMLPEDPSQLPRFICLMGEAFQEQWGRMSGFHKGVVGIVCQRLVDLYLRPAGIFANYGGFASGSFRSIEGYDMIANLKSQGIEEEFEKVGGHPAAAGGSILARNHQRLAEKLDRSVTRDFGAEYSPPTWKADAICSLRDLTPRAVAELRRFEPFGTDNPEPEVIIENLFVDGPPRVIGKHRNHLRVQLTDGQRSVEAIFWRRTEHEYLREGQRVHVLATPTLSPNGQAVQLTIKNPIHPSEVGKRLWMGDQA